MKKLFAIAFCACGLLPAFPTFAQEVAPTLKAEALTATRQLAAFISLDDARQLPVRRLTQLRLTQEADARQLYANDPDMLSKKLTAIGQDYTQQLSTVLTAAQYQRYVGATAGALPAAVAAVQATAPTPIASVAATPPRPHSPLKTGPAKSATRSSAPAPRQPVAGKAAVRR